MSELTEKVEIGKDTETAKKPNRIKEFFRKFLVSLKRRPQNIAMFVYIVGLLIYTLNLTSVSNTTAYIQKTPMGLCGFVAVLFSVLGFVCMINVYPKRQKPKYVMLVLFFIMSACIIVADIVYGARLNEGIDAHLATFTTAEQIAQFKIKYSYCYTVRGMLIAHMIIVAVSAVTFAVSPLIGKALKKIDTSVKVEYNSDIGTIDGEDD